MKSKENEYSKCYLSHFTLESKFVTPGILCKCAGYMTEYTDMIGRILKEVIQKRCRDDVDGYRGHVAISVKALITDNSGETLYMFGGSDLTLDERVSILGGGIALSDYLDDPEDFDMKKYLRSELVREIWENITDVDYGYANYITMDESSKCDVVGLLKHFDLLVEESPTWFCHYSEDEFTVYIPLVVVDKSTKSLNGSLVEYPYVQHKTLKSLIADGRRGIHTAQYLFDISDDDARLKDRDILDAIFYTFLGK